MHHYKFILAVFLLTLGACTKQKSELSSIVESDASDLTLSRQCYFGDSQEFQIQDESAYGAHWSKEYAQFHGRNETYWLDTLITRQKISEGHEPFEVRDLKLMLSRDMKVNPEEVESYYNANLKAFPKGHEKKAIFASIEQAMRSERSTSQLETLRKEVAKDKPYLYGQMGQCPVIYNFKTDTLPFLGGAKADKTIVILAETGDKEMLKVLEYFLSATKEREDLRFAFVLFQRHSMESTKFYIQTQYCLAEQGIDRMANLVLQILKQGQEDSFQALQTKVTQLASDSFVNTDLFEKCLVSNKESDIAGSWINLASPFVASDRSFIFVNGRILPLAHYSAGNIDYLKTLL